MKNPNSGGGEPKFLFCSKSATVEEKLGHLEGEEYIEQNKDDMTQTKIFT